MYRIINFLAFAVLLAGNSFAQIDANFTHHMHNTLAVNPAYAGTRGALTATILHRNQWVGFEGSPKTYTFTAHTPIIKENIGLGISAISDRIGPVVTTGMNFDFAYHLRVSKNARLSLGLKAGINHLKVYYSGLSLDDPRPDPAFSSDFESRYMPEFGFGLYLFTGNWYAGLSTPRLINNNLFAGSSTTRTSVLAANIPYFIILGTVFKIEENILLKPSSLIRAISGARLVADVAAMFEIDGRIEAGVLFRTGDAFGALFGFNLTDQIRIGYSYDWSVVNKSWKYNGGSHEVMMRFELIHKERGRRIVSPRYF